MGPVQLASVGIALALAVAGQADSGGTSTPPDGLVAPPDGKSLIVFYRTGGIKGVMLGCTVRDEEREVARLGPGKYAAIVVEPGAHRYYASDLKGVNVVATPGAILFVRCKIGGAIIASQAQLMLSNDQGFAAEASKLKPWQP